MEKKKEVETVEGLIQAAESMTIGNTVTPVSPQPDETSQDAVFNASDEVSDVLGSDTSDEQQKASRGFKFTEFDDLTSPDGGAGVSQQPNVTGSSNPRKGIVGTGFKAIGRVFEKALDELCRYKHGVSIDEIGAGINDRDLNMAADLYGEGAEKGELPTIPTWVILLALIGLIFAFPVYKVMTFTPVRPKRQTTDSVLSPIADDAAAIASMNESAPWGINPRTKRPYKRPPYDKSGKKGGKKK